MKYSRQYNGIKMNKKKKNLKQLNNIIKKKFYFLIKI
jgi:hypothetical protein